MTDITCDAVRDAELIITHAKWLYLEEQALALLSGRRGLSWTPLFPQSGVIQVVAFNGEHVGRIRRTRSERSARWLAIPPGGRPLGPFRTARAAARALRRR
jgi:hypothetical protein